tara:strand:+ start:31 stop:552 length:522 start_codon:yes stop_codon:yes gene_type:complete
MERVKHILYKTTNNLSGKYYFGVHNLSDPTYLGSGEALKKAIKKYGTKNFTREVISEFENPEDAFFCESLLVDKEMISRKDCYNMKIGGFGGACSEESAEKIRKSKLGDKNPNKPGEENSFFGKNHSTEQKLKWSKSRGVSILYEGVEYHSLREASRLLKKCRKTISKTSVKI